MTYRNSSTLFDIHYLRKMIKSVFSLLLISLAASSTILPFGETAVNSIFKDKSDALILFIDGAESSQKALAAVEDFSKEQHTKFIITFLNKESNNDHFNRFSQYIGANVQTLPQLIYMVAANKKYKFEGEISEKSDIEQFLNDIQSGSLKAYLKSAEIPTQQTGHVKTLVGKSFKDQVLNSQKEVLVKFYAPWCGHCKTLAPHFEAAAQKISSNPNVVLANFDSTENEIEGVEVSGFPTLYFWAKDKSIPPIRFDGARDAEGLLTFLKDHTQYPWIQNEESATPPQDQEL